MAACNLTVQTFGVHGLGNICAVAMAIPMEIIIISGSCVLKASADKC